MIYGYTHEASAHEDLKRLKALGAQEIVVEPGERYDGERAALDELFMRLKAHDQLVVTSLSHTCKSLHELDQLITRCQQRQIKLRSEAEGLELDAPHQSGLILAMKVLLEFDQQVRGELSRRGQQRARGRGQRVGRPSKFNNEVFRRKVMRMLNEDGMSAAEVARAFKVHPSTIYRLKKAAHP